MKKIILTLAVFFVVFGFFVENSHAKSFGFSRTELKEIVFNITDTSYYKSDVAAISQANSKMDNLSVAAAVNTINGNISAFDSETSNKPALYGMVDNYYANALQSTYGSLKTSFLSNIGIPAGLDISYLTILRRANIFLTKILDTHITRQRFDILLGSEFESPTSRTNFLPGLTVMISQSMVLREQMGMDTTYTTEWLQDMTNYPNVNLKSVNFFSLTYFLLHNAYYGQGKVRMNSKKLLKYITLAEYNRALALFHINMPVQKGHATIINFCATWAPPCKDETLMLERFYKSHKKNGIVVIEINVDKNPAAVRTFIEKYNGKYLINRIPQIFFISNGGRILYRWVGVIPKAVLYRYANDIR